MKLFKEIIEIVANVLEAARLARARRYDEATVLLDRTALK